MTRAQDEIEEGFDMDHRKRIVKWQTKQKTTDLNPTIVRASVRSIGVRHESVGNISVGNSSVGIGGVRNRSVGGATVPLL
jgi:hypothetical protein